MAFSSRTSTNPSRIAPLLGCAAVLTLAAGCSGGGDTSAQPSSPAPSSAASDSGASGPTVVVKGGDDAEGSAPVVTPGKLDQSSLPNTCSNEGSIRVPKGGKAEPALKGDAGTLSYVGMEKEDGTQAAQFTLDSGKGPQEMEPAKVGDMFEVGGHKYAVSSVCSDAAELDQVK